MTHERRRLPPAVALLLAVPLVAIAAWIVSGALRRSFGPAPGLAPVAGLPAPAGLGPPEADLPPDRFWERVDGAADALIAAGCQRMIVWRSATPPADIEMLVFANDSGAASFLTRDAGDGRDPGGPGDESSVAPESIFFRRGRHYVRVLAAAAPAPEAGPASEAPRADHAAAPAPPPAGGDSATLLDLARNVDSAIAGKGMQGVP